jgi:hypothetical protein
MGFVRSHGSREKKKLEEKGMEDVLVISSSQFYEDLLAHVMTVNVLTADTTSPARIAPSMAWFSTTSGKIFPSHDTTLGTAI